MSAVKKHPVWVFASHGNGQIDEVVLELLGKGRQLAEMSGMPLEAVLFGTSVTPMGQTLLDYGAATVHTVEHEALSSFNSGIQTFLLSKLIEEREPGVVLFGSDNQTAALAARTAARFNTGLSAHCIDLKFQGTNLVQTVPGFGGTIAANIICPEARPQMATVAPGMFKPVKGKTRGARITKNTVDIPKRLLTESVKTVKHLPSDRSLQLASAQIVVAGGFGVGSKKNWRLVEELADLLDAGVGATRPPVDEGWANTEQMIGASGITIKPRLYIAIGISGMMHHTVGIQDAETIVAINSNPQAPIFSMADYGIVGDLQEVVPALIHLLKTGESLAPILKPTDHTKPAEAYKESLKKLRPNIYKFGELVRDATEDPRTKRTVEGHAQIFEASQDPEYQEIVTTVSHLTGKRISRYLSIIRSPEDMYANSKMKRLMFNLTGTCTGGRCAGWNAMNALWSTSWDMDHDLGTAYHPRLRKWLLDAQERDITLAGALTDPKGNRRLPPSRQADPDMYLRVVKKEEGGVVVRGAKVMICGTAAANELFVMPGTRLKSSDAAYAIAFAIPKDAEGITIVEARHASDHRELEDGFDNPVTRGGITQAYIFFEDVFVPTERIFMCGEARYAGEAVYRFTLPYRSAIGACVAGQGDVMIGASILIARSNGLKEKVFRDKLVRMIINNETTFGMGLAAATMGSQHPSGSWMPNPVLANVNKVHVGTLPYETKRLTQEIAGGIGETGCMPSYRDFIDSRYGHLIQKYLKAHSPAETRVRIARLVEWLTLGGGVPGCMHGGGSPDGARLTVFAETPFDDFVDLAKQLGGINDISLS